MRDRAQRAGGTLDSPETTCIGAQRAGSDAGVAPYTGKYLGTWPGQSRALGYEPGPYVNEAPLLEVTAAHAIKHAASLTAGQKGLLRQYPKAFRMKVYPSHRDFRFADWVCETVKRNVEEARVVNDGRGIDGVSGAIPFPFP